MVKRTSLIIRYYNKKAIKEVEKYGELVHVSKTQKYTIMYCDKDKVDEMKTKISKLRGINKVEETLVDMARFDFEE